MKNRKVANKAGPVRWGILGTGDIARQFASDLNLLDDAHLLAVGSRSQENAERFGAVHGIPKPYSSYEALAHDPEVDLVYIATPHPRHAEDAILCLERGKGVVCEKPFALNSTEAGRMVATAREKKLFLMEAMWMLCFPAVREVLSVIRRGDIGEPRLLRADFCFRIPLDPQFRLFNPTLGGGALLDVGVYPIALAHSIFGSESENIASVVHIGSSGVDEQSSILLEFSGGRIANLSCASRTALPQEAFIAGTEGWIRIPRFSQPDSFTLGDSKREETRRFERIGFGYAFEALEAMRAFANGERESPLMPLDFSLSVMRTLDRIRTDWGLRYPSEEIPQTYMKGNRNDDS